MCSHFFSIWFYNGVFLSDPYKTLINASEGKTKSLRQWRFSSHLEIDEKKISEYILEAIEIEKKGLKIKPEKTTKVEIPAILNEIFIVDEPFKKAFLQLTLGRQKEYINYLNEAKQEKTKFSRIEKIKPMIFEGKGLHDKYK